ncbi:MAG TPA: GAF domain-containing protein [Methylomirabilota bacterium]|nr:GAF domain-containing protein [Methylomirabilota bacterium]
MRRGAKPAKPKVEAKLPVARKSRNTEVSTVRDLKEHLAEALAQQAAMTEILRLISSSLSDLQPIIDTVAECAARLCEASDAQIFLLEGDTFHLAASHGPLPPARLVPVTRGSVAGRAVIDRHTIHVRDIASEPVAEFPDSLAKGSGWRTVLAEPLLRGGVPIGAILIRRTQVRPFSDRQLALLKTFADQAVIAIENVRLFKELDLRNRELRVTLEQQTAAGEVLRVISTSPTDTQPVFQAIIESAVRLCGGSTGAVLTVESEQVHLRAGAGFRSETGDAVHGRFPIPLDRDSLVGRIILDGDVAHVPDFEIPGAVPETARTVARMVGYRSALATPMFQDGRPMGLLFVGRSDPGRFSDDESRLLQTFADQAVIAIENVRLFTELQEKNRALTQAHGQVTAALEQQTATSEVLRAIAHTQTDAQPVFDTIVRSAARLCQATVAAIFLTDGRMVYHLADYGSSPEALETQRARFPWPVAMDTTSGMAILTRAIVHVPDIEEPSTHDFVRQSGRLLGFRSVVAVPMLRDGEPVGTINVTRREAGRFSDGEVALLKTFADQAVIAVENVRLFKELEARTTALTRSVDQLTALGEVGRAVSSTLDLETVLTTIVVRAVELSELDGGVVFEYDEGAEEFVQRAATETGGALAEARRSTRIRKGEGALGRTAITLEPVQVPDITVPGAHESRLREILIEAGVRAVLAVPMVREGRLIGCLGVTRNDPGAFPAETMELLRTFATQSALAIQNARLFHEIEDKSRQLEAASRHKSEFLANMSHELRTPLNAIIGFSEVLGERMFGELNAKQEEYLRDIHASGQHLLSLINDILDLSKIEAGRMELEPTDFNLLAALDSAMILVRERAGRHGIALHMTADERVGQVRADERKIRQVVLNLLSNAIKFTPDGGRIDVRAVPVDGGAEVSVSDTGVGIAPVDQEAIFEEFRQVGTAAKKVEGTGLGLALSRRFVELHGGRIWVDSRVGVGSTFTFTIPVRRGE